MECLGSSLEAFFSKDVTEKIVFGRDDLFEKVDDEELKGKITWLVPSAQKNTMEPILLELGPGGRSQQMMPHDGEEFGYVLSGAVQLVLGGKKHRVGAGESFCLHPREPHHIVNQGKRVARVVWVVTPPSF